MGLLAAAAIGGCGGEEISTSGEIAVVEPAGTADLTVADRVSTIDPLFARTRAERLVARQVFEPLVSRQRGPFGETRVRDGIARSIRSSNDNRTWIARLRPGVRFTSGARLDAGAVIANVNRWLASPAGKRALPMLSSVFSPAPGVVRFELSAPDPRFDDRLADGRMGLVAPSAIERADGGPVGLMAAGAGPFELRDSERRRVLLARNPQWWGTPLGLGPGVDTLEFETVPQSAARAEMLLAGQAVVADQLDSLAFGLVAAEPLTVTLGDEGDQPPPMGVSRSVRGLSRTTADQSLAEVWLTTLR